MEQIIEVYTNKISLNPNQPRKEFDKDKIKELADSIKSNGLINPIQIKQVGEKYQLVCGERRLKAHQLAKIPTIKAILKKYNSEQSEMVESLIENLHRANLNSVEKENYITKLWETKKYKTKEELGKALGYKRSIILYNLNSKEIRDKIKIPKEITTRAISDTYSVKDINDKEKVLKKVADKEILSSKIREFSKVISKSPSDVKEAVFKNKITIKQAESISKITDDKIRKKLINAHKEIKNIDKGLEKSIKIKPITKTEKIIRTKELINLFRQNSIESQKANQITIKSLMKCIPLINIMDDNQLNQLKYYQELLESSLNNILELLENLKIKIKEI